MPVLWIVLGRLVHQLEGVFIKKYNAKHEKGGFIFTAIVSLFSMLFFLLTDIVTDENGLRFSSDLIVYGVIGVVVAVILWAFWYVLSYYGIFNATALFGETASLSNGVFNTLQTLVKPYLDMLPDLLAGIGGGVPA